MKDEETMVIANNEEKYVAFHIGNLRFLDSMQFMNASLASLVANLRAEGKFRFQHTRRHIPVEEVDLFMQKGHC